MEMNELATEVFTQAIKHQLDDIHLLPVGEEYVFYLRDVNGLKKLRKISDEVALQFISYLKYQAGMDVGERRRPQSGSLTFEISKEQMIELRLSVITNFKQKESMVIRLLHDEERELRFWFDQLPDLQKKLAGRGLYLFAGPVGSGKTTLMHALAQERFADQQVMSIEDPVEIKQENMLQLQLNDQIGMTYDNLIKLSLRHRPDLLIIGEIRDKETARAVVRASLTGVTVFSTIHAKSVRGVYERLLELGVSEEELKIVLQGICYQRLIAGGGVVDFATENYQEHSASRWNQQMDLLAQSGYIQLAQAQAEKIIYR